MKPDRARILSEGLITGLLGYAVVVVFYGILNLVTGLSFFSTAARLGAGLVSPESNSAVGAVLAFNGLHVVVFLLVGLLVAWLVMQMERRPSFFVLALFMGVIGLFAVMAAFLSFAARSGVETSDRIGVRGESVGGSGHGCIPAEGAPSAVVSNQGPPGPGRRAPRSRLNHGDHPRSRGRRKFLLDRKAEEPRMGHLVESEVARDA